MEITTEQLTTMVTEAAQKGAEAAVRAVNTVDPAERPGGGKSAKAEAPSDVNINLKRNQTPNMGRALRAAFLGKWKDASLEKDFSQAVRALYPTTESEGDFSWPTTVEAYYNVLEAGAFRDVASDFQKAAYRTISEGTPTTSATGGGVLTPIAFLQDQFVTALTSPVAVLAAPGTDVIPITNPVVSLPRESTAATTAVAAEAGTLSPSDPTFAQQTFAAKKIYGYAQFSNELLADANPALMGFISRSLGRNVGLQKDLQFLAGSGSGANLQGIAGYGSITTAYTAATNGEPITYDAVTKILWGMRRANIDPTAWIMHSALAQALSLVKDTVGYPLFRDANAYALGGIPAPLSAGGFGSQNYSLQVAKGTLLNLPVFFSNQLSITQVQGNASTGTTLYCGDFNYCRVLERQAVDIAVSEHINFTTDQTAVRAIWRGALALTQPAAFSATAGFLVS